MLPRRGKRDVGAEYRVQVGKEAKGKQGEPWEKGGKTKARHNTEELTLLVI